MSKLLLAAKILSEGRDGTLTSALAQFREAMAEGADLSQQDENGMRAVDLLVRGRDTLEAAGLIEEMAESGFVEEMMVGPDAGTMPPMFMAGFSAKPAILEKFMELGMPGESRFTSPKDKILNGTVFHAIVVGFREAQKDEFAQCLRVMLAYCPDGIDLQDRLKMRPVDWAVRVAAATGDSTLSNAMVSYGAIIENGTGRDARSLLQEMMKAPGNENLKTVLTHGAANSALRAIEAESAQASRPRP